MQYFTERKIEEAKKLLRSTDLSVTEISDRLGYDTSGYFCRQFKLRTGETPLKYKKRTS